MAKRRGWYAMMAVVLSLFVGLAIIEMVLSERQRRIAQSNQFAPGLFMPDPILGWRTGALWLGRHKHWDFDTEYSTTAEGFRVTTGEEKDTQASLCAIVGDSFTFGLGVRDGETFASVLNSQSGRQIATQNWGMPGYSTDQEYLLLKERISVFRPVHIILVLYVANDFFDNLRSVPMQVGQAKPFFTLSGSNLNLTLPNRVPAPEPSEDFASYVLGKSRPKSSSNLPFSTVWTALGLLKDPLAVATFSETEFLDRSKPALAVTFRLIEEIKEVCRANAASFSLAVLTGRSHILEPKTVSARFQEALRQATIAFAKEKGIPVIDLAEALQSSPSPAELFFPNDGHLTPEGHRKVAETLAKEAPFRKEW